MTTPPTFSSGAVLTASNMNSVGLWLVKTQAVGSGVSSVAVTNAFSSDYPNYLITMSGGTVSADASVGIQLGASTTGYYGFMVYGNVAAATVLGVARNNTALMNYAGGGTGGFACSVNVQVMNPNVANFTQFIGRYQNSLNYGTLQGEHRVSTAYTGFTLVPDAGTLTGGTIYVYGYKGTV